MAIDPSIPLGVKTPEQPNPLAMLGQFQQIQNAQAFNRLINQNVANAQLQNQQANQNLSIQGATRGAQVLAPLLMLPDSQLTPDKFHTAVDEEVASRQMQPQVAQMFHDIINRAGDDPSALRSLGMRVFVTSMGGQEAANQIFGQNQDMSNGQAVMPGVRQSPMMGGGWTPAGGAIPQLLSPAEKASPRPFMTPGGQPGQVPTSAVVDDRGNPRGGAMGNGTYGGGAQPGSPPGFTPTGLPAGTDQNITAFNTAQADVPNAVNRIAGLQKAYSALSMVNSGPGTGKWNQIRAALESLPVVNGLTKPSVSTVGTTDDYALAQKYLQDYANRSTIGTTAQGLQAVAHANASTDIPQGAALDVIRTNIGLERMAIAQTKTANKMSYLDDAQKFATANDRRAFAADMYTPQQLKQLVGGMKRQEQERFFRSLGVATRLGLVSMPQQQPAPVASSVPSVPTR